MFEASEMEVPGQSNNSRIATQLVMFQKWIEIVKMFIAPGIVFLLNTALAGYCTYDPSVLRIITVAVFGAFSLIFLLQRRKDS